MLLQTVKYIELTGTKDRPQEVTVYDYDDYFFTSLNVHGLKHLTRMNKTVFEFDDPSILDSTTDLVSGMIPEANRIYKN